MTFEGNRTLKKKAVTEKKNMRNRILFLMGFIAIKFLPRRIKIPFYPVAEHRQGRLVSTHCI
jgi:hypothetical protein